MRLLFVFLIAASSLMASSQEELFLRRIDSLLTAHEYSFAERHIEQFSATYPQSPHLNSLYARLGQIAFEQKHYDAALACFERVKDEKLLVPLRIYRWHALYEQRCYEDLLQEITPALMRSDKSAVFYFAESCLRLSLTDRKASEALLREAIGYYETLLDSERYSLNAQAALAEIYRTLGQEKLALEYYSELADALQKKEANFEREDTLLHAAASLACHDEGKAQKIASHLAHFGLHKKREGAILWFDLLIKAQDKATLKQEQLLFLSLLPAEKAAIYHLILGRLAMEERDFTCALPHLEKAALFPLPHPEGREAIIAYVICAQSLNEITLLEKAASLMEKRLPNDPEREQCDLFLVEAYAKEGEFEKAFALLNKLENAGADAPVLLAKARTLALKGNNVEAHTLCRRLTEHFPCEAESYRLAIAFAQLPQDLAEDLERALSKDFLFTKEERPTHELHLAQCYLTLGKNKEAALILERLLEEHHCPSEVHFYLSLCYLSTGEVEKGVMHGEEALSLDASRGSKLHLYLAQGYDKLLKGGKLSVENRLAYHLYLSQNDHSLSAENRFYLASYFAKVEEESKAIALLEPLLENDAEIERFTKEAAHLATLYNKTGAYEKEQALRQRLLALQQSGR